VVGHRPVRVHGSPPAEKLGAPGWLRFERLGVVAGSRRLDASSCVPGPLRSQLLRPSDGTLVGAETGLELTSGGARAVGAADPMAKRYGRDRPSVHASFDVNLPMPPPTEEGRGVMSPSAQMPDWTKSPEELQDAFRTALDRFPDAERRQMFGYPAAFANGNMWTGLHTTNWVVRLPDAKRAELLEIEGAAAFEPMPGRPMTGFATLPVSVLASPDALNHWLTVAWEHALAMPPKQPKAPKVKR
jgi:hypothetical protein